MGAVPNPNYPTSAGSQYIPNMLDQASILWVIVNTLCSLTITSAQRTQLLQTLGLLNSRNVAWGITATDINNRIIGYTPAASSYDTSSQVTTIFNSAGSYTFDTPSWATALYVTVLGAGGAGGGGTTNASAASGGGGGGGGSCVSRWLYTPDTEYSVQVGTGGGGGVADTDGTAGTYSAFGAGASRTSGPSGSRSADSLSLGDGVFAWGGKGGVAGSTADSTGGNGASIAQNLGGSSLMTAMANTQAIAGQATNITLAATLGLDSDWGGASGGGSSASGHTGYAGGDSLNGGAGGGGGGGNSSGIGSTGAAGGRPGGYVGSNHAKGGSSVGGGDATASEDGLWSIYSLAGGGGAGGGGTDTTFTAGSGGAGASGSGGGGGGSSSDVGTAGVGGNGGDGIVVVVAH